MFSAKVLFLFLSCTSTLVAAQEQFKNDVLLDKRLVAGIFDSGMKDSSPETSPQQHIFLEAQRIEKNASMETLHDRSLELVGRQNCAAGSFACPGTLLPPLQISRPTNTTKLLEAAASTIAGVAHMATAWTQAEHAVQADPVLPETTAAAHQHATPSARNAAATETTAAKATYASYTLAGGCAVPISPAQRTFRMERRSARRLRQRHRGPRRGRRLRRPQYLRRARESLRMSMRRGIIPLRGGIILTTGRLSALRRRLHTRLSTPLQRTRLKRWIGRMHRVGLRCCQAA